MKIVFPKEILENSSEIYRYRFLKKSHVVYMILLISLIIAALVLPFVKIDLYTACPGMIRPRKEKNLITSPINGKIEDIRIVESAHVKKGDTLIKLDNKTVYSDLNLAEARVDSLECYISDLEYICVSKTIHTDSIQSALFLNQWEEYKQKLKAMKQKVRRFQVVFKRQLHLYDKGVISKVDMENARFELRKVKNELEYFKKRQKTSWLNELNQKRVDLNLVLSKVLSLTKKNKLHYILSPTTGHIQELKGLERNSFLYRGSAIAEISPQTDLMVECYVSPNDIGMLKKNQLVKFQIDAFDHNRWGSATGSIEIINQDVSNINDLPMFKVFCSINESALLLNKMTQGNLQKGMTLKALFFINKRSVFDLLFDKLEDWYNPSSYNLCQG